MAQTFCTGPVHIAFGTGSTGITPPATSVYYGTTRSGPDINEEPSYFNVMNDLGGPNLPFDRGYAGSEHTITLEMTRWDGTVDATFDTTPTPLPLGALTGAEAANARGALVSKLSGIQLLMLLSNGGVVLPADSLMIRWRRYFQTVCVGPNKPIWGNKENMRVRIFKSQNVFLGVNVTNLSLPAFRLFDEATGALPAGWGFTIT